MIGEGVGPHEAGFVVRSVQLNEARHEIVSLAFDEMRRGLPLTKPKALVEDPKLPNRKCMREFESPCDGGASRVRLRLQPTSDTRACKFLGAHLDAPDTSRKCTPWCVGRGCFDASEGYYVRLHLGGFHSPAQIQLSIDGQMRPDGQ